MDRKAFRAILADRILVMDGAMGTELLRLGLSTNDCLELANRERPELVGQIHQQYLEAGANIISTNTFGANRFRLDIHGLADQVQDLVRRGVVLALQAAAGRAMVSLSVGPSGLRLGNDQELSFSGLVDAFREQIIAGVKEGVDLISLETMLDIVELKAAVIAARQVCDLPIMAQLTFTNQLCTLSGTPAAAAAVVLSGLDIDLIGANCSEGPEQLLKVIEQMSPVSSLPLIVQPNAGLPVGNSDGAPNYPVTPLMMADTVHRFAQLGTRVIGSCCGSHAEFTRAIGAATQFMGKLPLMPNCSDGFLASHTRHLIVSHQSIPVLISERFSANHRSDLRQALAERDRLAIMDEAVEQRSAGAHGLNISVKAPGLDELSSMKHALSTVQQAVALPLSVQSSDPEVLETALQSASGRPLLNAVDATEESITRLVPLARSYGAMLIVIPQDRVNMSYDPRKMLAATRRVFDRALQLGLRPQDLVVDCLANRASGSAQDLELTLRFSELVHEELGLFTLFGVSGVSMGKKQRAALNAAYAAMSIHAGADILIGNPLQRELVSSILASAELMGRMLNSLSPLVPRP